MQNNINLAFIILAAGKGTRMKNHHSKVMHPLAGKNLIDYSFDLSDSFDPENISVIISEDQDDLKLHINSNCKNIDVLYQKERLGTGHAVREALSQLGDKNFDRYVILYGDTPLIKKSTIEKLLSKIDNNVALSLLGFEKLDHNKYGRLIIDDSNNLRKIVEYNEASDEERKVTSCNSGIMVFNGEYIDSIINKIGNNNSKGEYYLTDAVDIANNMNLSCKVVETNEAEVLGINSQSERAMAEKLVQQELRQKHLDEGVIMIDPDTVYFTSDVKIAAGTIIHPFVNFLGKVIINGACEIKSFSSLEDCVIEKNSIIGPYARIRPGTIISEDSKVGNFVEIKKSRIGRGSKISHLSYIGDTEMGENVNVGAGTITCNYDGKNKFKTKIEDNCFIGSNSSLVAPIKISYNSVIGAGSTILKDTVENSVSVNKKEQINLKDR
jgi:bifunctional UDP-N-acetylglucosamine pyrophosphorylase/glucosamine-1-phosphate N-acetyltransferase